MSNVKKSISWTMEVAHKNYLEPKGSDIIRSIFTSHVMIIENPQTLCEMF